MDNIDEFRDHLQKALNLSLSIDFDIGLAALSAALGAFLIVRGLSHEECLECFDKAKELHARSKVAKSLGGKNGKL